MWHRILRRKPFLAFPQASGTAWRSAARAKRRPAFEPLEGRELMTASLAAIPDVAAPAGEGYQLTLDGSASGATDQTFTATSDNPNISVSVADGQFWTIDVLHLSAGGSDPTIINEPMTFQFFPEVAPNTVQRITNFSNNGYYVDTGRYFPRIFAGFVAQGGSDSPTSTSSSSGVTPIGTEVTPSVDFSSYGQLAMANTGSANSSDAQFFITYGPQSSLNQKYTIFGQQVSGYDTLEKLSQVSVTTNSSGENSVPVNPVTITSSTISDTNPNGALLIDTTKAAPGSKATITVTATDPADGTTTSQKFTVYVAGDTQAVRQIGDVLIATPIALGKFFGGTNTIEVKQVAAPTIPASQQVQVFVNGVLDTTQPSPDSLSQIIVQGSKANDNITVDNSVTVPTTADGGQGGKNRVTAGGGYSISHGWFGKTTLVAGDGQNKLIGRAGRVRFRANANTDYAYAGEARGRASNGQTLKPTGTYYRYINGHLVPVLKIRSSS
ncbi:peptidylprolyl isomerase [Paludisphaera rhizosphaerae]|uniref:peptidylprolyl isomerase n=1 Tax=Paludisphaera rhizosphaerae TaxID=2711216 RepID=UPI0013EA1A03|nr:peptidylprolyl isomerase [Paludisphaera rhizosphaerae]